MRKVHCYLAVVSLSLAFAHPVSANPNRMEVGGLTSQPIGHYEFCRADPPECKIRPGDVPRINLTNVSWTDVMEVNLLVNSSVKPAKDYDIHGKDEVWSYPKGVGDCEDYVLEKRRLLNEKYGMSLANLLITVVRKPDDEGHAVLTVRTDHGDYILDNLTNKVKLWKDTPYKFLKRQAAWHTGRWVSLGSVVASRNVASSSNNR